MPEISIVQLKKSDIPSIQSLALSCWLFAYKGIYTEKNIKKFVDEYYSGESFDKLFSLIKKGSARFFVAKEDTKKKAIVGYAQVVGKGSKWELSRIYVDPKKTRRGIGSLLIKEVERFLKRKQVGYYVAHPHDKNKLAKNFYVQLGFKRAKWKDRAGSSPCFLKHIEK